MSTCRESLLETLFRYNFFNHEKLYNEKLCHHELLLKCDCDVSTQSPLLYESYTVRFINILFTLTIMQEFYQKLWVELCSQGSTQGSKLRMILSISFEKFQPGRLVKIWPVTLFNNGLHSNINLYWIHDFNHLWNGLSQYLLLNTG